ncbi:MAG: DUF2946 family protein [Burkholderiaceae bacterium]
MDPIVQQAIAKWPNVPHCYGWLALDARGAWRMRDEAAQAQRLPGDPIRNAALRGFIDRNYTHDDAGRWYFQNGPQRVYVNLEITPYIAHTDPAQGFVLHHGEALPLVDSAWLTEDGQLILQAGERVAALDDRDLAQCLAAVRRDGAPVDDEQLLAWLAGNDERPLTLEYGGQRLPLQRIARAGLARHFGFVTEPQPDGK